jgi:hypothetical protein
MTPRHFANYAKEDPKGYNAFSDSMWNGFVSITHKIGLSPFFSFTPKFLQAKQVEQSNGRFEPGEIPGDQDQTL